MPDVVALLPLLKLVGVFGLVIALLRLSSQVGLALGLVVGLLAAVAWAWGDRSIRPHQVKQILLDPKIPRMWSTLAGVFIFKTVMQTSGAGQEVGKVLTHLEIPLEWMVVLLPIILGAISGLPLAFVAVTFPILVPLIQAIGNANMEVPLTILAYVSGFTGVVVSPLHLCLILSNEYFRAPWSNVYSRLWLPTLILLGGGIGYFWVLKVLIG